MAGGGMLTNAGGAKLRFYRLAALLCEEKERERERERERGGRGRGRERERKTRQHLVACTRLVGETRLDRRRE